MCDELDQLKAELRNYELQKLQLLKAMTSYRNKLQSSKKVIQESCRALIKMDVPRALVKTIDDTTVSLDCKIDLLNRVYKSINAHAYQTKQRIEKVA